jgi:hypothetical protein
MSNLANQQNVVIDGIVVPVTEAGDSVFRARGCWYSSASGAELDLHMRPFGPQIAFRVDSTHDLSMAGVEWMPWGESK